ncbi:MAG: hypothetical protein WCB12_12975 [Bryobacteraceae bacterium]
MAVQAIFDLTGERFAERTISRTMSKWRAQRARVSSLRDLGIGIAAVRGDEQAVQSLTTRGLFAPGEGPARTDELVRSLQRFIRRPTPEAMAEILFSCLIYQIGAGLAGRKGQPHA